MVDRDLRFSRGAGRGSPRRSKLALVALIAVIALTPILTPATADLAPTPFTTFPNTTTVGVINQPFSINVTNSSTGNPPRESDDDITVQLTEIGITPSCAQFSGGFCSTPELGVFDIATGPAAAVGTGGACIGVTFAVTGPDASGRFQAIPNSTVLLGPSNPASNPTLRPTFCVVQFILEDVERVPTVDVDPVMPFVQTRNQIDATIIPAVQPGENPNPPIAPGRQGTLLNTATVTVLAAPVTLETVSTPNGPTAVPPGSTATDQATIARVNPGGADPTGTVTFRLVGPNPDAACAGPTVFTSAPVAINPATGVATSPTSPALAAGTYNWVATYSGDANYLPITTEVGCNDPDERFIVAIPPQIQVDKTANPLTRPEPGGDFTYTIVVTNPSPTVPITITTLNDSVYGNLAARGTCTTAIGTVLAVSPGPGNTYSCSFTAPFTGAPGATLTDIVTVVGTDAVGQTATDSDDATVGITGVPPQVMVDKTANPLTRPEPGGDFTYTVVVTNTSTIETLTITSLTDSVYGNLAVRGTCTTAIGTTLAVSPGPGNTYTCQFTAPFTGQGGATLTDIVTVVGVDPEGETATDADDATVSITDVLPRVGVVKTAIPTTMPEPGGDFVFAVTVSNPGTEPIIITQLNDTVYGDLATLPAPAGATPCSALINTTLAAGASSPECRFVGNFTGVAGDSETDVVTVTARDDENNTVTATDDATVTLTGAPAIRVDKTADPSSRPEPGGDFTYTVVVTNVGAQPLTITSLNDNIYGNLATRPGSNCGARIGTVLAPGASSVPCTFTAPFTGNAGASLTDIVTVVGTNPTGQTVTDDDDATVTLTPVPPMIDVDKTANPLTRPAPGGDFTYTVVVNNPSTVEAVTITSLVDNPYGDLATRPGSTCGALIGTTLAPGATSAPCTFTAPFNGAAGASLTDVVTVTGVDNDGQTVTANDDATVSLIGVTPAIRVDKSATPPTRPAPGGAFTFDVVVTNTGPTTLTITELTDDIYGNLATRGTCTNAIGTVLLTGASYSCSFQGDFTGIGGQSQTDVVTVRAVDVNNTQVTDDDDATVTLTNVAPTVQVVKTANPLSLPEPGGEFTFTVVVTNTSAEPVTVTSLIDNVYGNLATRPGSTCGTVVGTVLAPGASSPPCTFTGNFFGNAGASETDIVTVVVTDQEGTTATDDDDAVVSITDVPPTIEVVKTANPLTRPAPGGTFTFDVVVTNTSFEPVTITALTDNIYGNLNGRGTCATGAVLPANGGTYTCSFPGDFNGPPNASQTDIVTVTAIDEDGTTVTASDDATVTLTGVPATLTTVASAGAVGAEVFDTATLAGGFNPTGTITFRLYGPNDDLCANPPIFTSVRPVTGTTDPRIIESERFILPAPGIYHFVATYSGDVNNPPITTACDDPAETIGVGRLPVSLVTNASSDVLVGGAVFDTATIAGGFNPTGSIRFDLYGPNNATCTGAPVFTSTVPVAGNGNYTSGSFTPTQPGIYRFVATYSGDANNAGVTTACDDPLEQVEVTTVPVIRVEKTANPTTLVAPGGNVVFDVVVTNTTNVALTIRSLVDSVYGDLTQRAGSTCASAIGTLLQPAPGPGNTYSCRFTAAVQGAAGTTHTNIVTVTATDSTGRTVTDDDDAVVTITAVPPTITSTKTATPVSRPEPGGTFTFTFSVTNTGPNPVTITSLVDDIYGNLNGRGTCAVGAVLATNATYTCTFTGNFTGNAGASQTDVITVTARDEQGQTVTSQAQATVTITDVPPTISVTKTPDPISRPVPGGIFRFTVVVTNTSAEPVTITRLIDDIYGDFNGRGSCAVGIVLAPGASYSCAFDGEFRGQAGASQTDTVTVTAVDDDNTPVTATAKATVTLTPVGTPPVIPPPPPVPQPPVVIQTPPRTLVRTGSEFSDPARLAGILLIIGITLVAATRRFGDGPSLALLPVNPGRGPRGPWSGGGGPGGGGHRFDGGLGLRLPRGPGGGSSGGAARPLPAPPAPPAPDLDWDGWVSGRRPAAAPPAPARPEPVAVVEAEPVVAEVVPEVVEATVVTFGGRGGLDAAALDAAAALTPAPRPSGPPASRRSRRH
jgi:uncharacterized repeat protein (TIGR01451 family)